MVNMDSKDKPATVKPAFSIIVGIICFILLTIFDHLTKQWAVFRLRGQEPLVVINNVFEFYYLENRGAAFSIMQGRGVLLILISLIILALIVFFYARIPFKRRYRILRILMVFIAAGAVGNLIDRVSQHYVVDFFYFYGIDYPVFNVADIYVTVSVIILVLVVIFMLKEKDFTEIADSLSFKKRNPEDES